MGRRHIASFNGHLLYRGDAFAGVENDVSGENGSRDRFELDLRTNPAESSIKMNGEKLSSVVSIEVRQTTKHQPRVVLHLHPDAVTINAEAETVQLFDRSEGWDPYDGLYRKNTVKTP